MIRNSTRKTILFAVIVVFVISSLLFAQGTSLVDAVKSGNTVSVQAEIDKAGYVDQSDANQVTPLMIASLLGNQQVVKLLLENGASTNMEDSSGNTPLHYAAQCSDPNIIVLLIDHDADPNVFNAEGHTPQQIATSKGHVQTAQVIARESLMLNIQAMDPLAVARDILEDPNLILAKIKMNPTVAAALMAVQKSQRQEESAWLSRRMTQRSRLSKAVQKQVGTEFKMVLNSAEREKSQLCLEEAKEVTAHWDKRFDVVSKELRAQSRPERPASQRSRSRSERYEEMGQPVEVNPVDQEEQEILQAMSSWMQSGSDNREQLCNTLRDEYLADMVLLRALAEHEKANDTVLSIESLMLSRNANTDKIIASIIARQERDAMRPDNGTGQQNSQRSRGRR